MLKLDRLVIAMAEQEGWQPIDSAKGFTGSASYRRHNPLNLRASPFAISTENGFAVFRNDMDGFAAARWDILQKAKGNTTTGLNGSSTLDDLIHVWAPASDKNDPQSYVQNVLRYSGLSATMLLAELLT